MLSITASETRHQSFYPIFVPRINPAATSGSRPTFSVGGFRNRIALIEIFQKPETPKPMFVFCIT